MTAWFMMNLFNLGAVVGSLFIIWFVTWTFLAKSESMWDEGGEDDE